MIPRHISNAGLISSKIFLLHAAVCDIYGFHALTRWSCLLYITSYLHWNNLKTTGIIKTLDMATVFTSVAYMRLYIRQHFVAPYKYLWDGVTVICIITYALNTYIFKKQILDSTNKNIMTRPYNYFLLEYTPENSVQRMQSYKYHVYVHLFFMHILSSCSSMISIITSKRV